MFLAISSTCYPIVSDQNELSHLGESVAYSIEFPESIVDIVDMFRIDIPHISNIGSILTDDLLCGRFKIDWKFVGCHSKRKCLSIVAPSAYLPDSRKMSIRDLFPKITSIVEMIFHHVFSSLPSPVCFLHLIKHHTDKERICLVCCKSSSFIRPFHLHRRLPRVRHDCLHLILAINLPVSFPHLNTLLNQFVPMNPRSGATCLCFTTSAAPGS